MAAKSTKTAVIKTGGRQYVVSEGGRVKVDKLPVEEGKTFTFEEVLLTATEKTAKIGTPLLAGAKVEAEVVAQARYPKVVGAKVKAKKRYRRYFGHKQPYTELEIKKIVTK